MHPTRTETTRRLAQPQSIRRVALIAIALLGVAAMQGCTSAYSTPGRAADFSALGLSIQTEGMTPSERTVLTDRQIQDQLRLQPLASFPARIAMAQVQVPDYVWSGRSAYAAGSVAIVEVHHDPAMENAIASIAQPPLPGVTAIAPLSRLLIPTEIRQHADLRSAAASLHADMLLLYTFDTRVADDEFLPYVGVLTLGMFPDRVKRATSNASAVLIDTRNGFVYATATGIAETDEVANLLGSSKAFDKALKRVEAAAMIDLVRNMRTAWAMVLTEHAPQLAAGMPPVQSPSARTQSANEIHGRR